MDTRQTARRILVTFLATFLVARIVVLLIMSRRMPDLFLHLGGTHVHHLNYGILLLCGVGAYLLLRQPAGRAHRRATILYAIGLGLTVDEFGMWVHLGGAYWQRASFDAVVAVAATLAAVAYAPRRGLFRRRHLVIAILLALILAVFALLLAESVDLVSIDMERWFEGVEESGPR